MRQREGAAAVVRSGPAAPAVALAAPRPQLAAAGPTLAADAQALLRLQRSHGNRFVQRVLGGARRGGDAASGELDPGLASRIERARGGGQVLDSGLRRRMEGAFGADLGHVRLHTGAEADGLSRALAARAFTTGPDIFFRAGAFAPGSSGGRELLAHELTHVVQQAGAPVRAKLTLGSVDDPQEREADVVAGRVARMADDDGACCTPCAGGGTCEGGETVRRQPAPAVPPPVPPFRPAPGQLGREATRVTRAGARRIAVEIDRTVTCGWTRRLDLVFDPDDDCRIETGGRVEFLNPPAAAQRLPAGEFEGLARRFLDAANTYLDGWYALRITGSGTGCTAPCRDVEMPIRVRLTRQTGGHPITLSAGSGRENVGQFYGSTDTWTLRHEAGHVALGISDEYEESGIPCREGEHVEERDYSLMASQFAFGRRSLLHPRHFSHIVQWFQTEYPGCRIELIPRREPRPVDFDAQIGMGGFGMGRSTGLAMSGGLRLGFPLDRLRDWALFVGPHAHLLTGSGDEFRNAYLLGLRFGLERRFTPSAGGPYLGGFAEFGYGRFSLKDYSRGVDAREGGAYGLFGLRAGWGFQQGLIPSPAIEGSLGTPIGAPGRIGAPGGGPLPATREGWWQLGLSATLRF